MASYKEIMEMENKTREAGRFSTILLFGDKQFWRAYEWSAWLFVRYVNDYKVNKIHWKEGNMPLTFIGFPIKNIEHYSTPDRIFTVDYEKKQAVLELPSTTFSSNDTPESLSKQFVDWKTNKPFTDPKHSKNDYLGASEWASAGSALHKAYSILTQIGKYPIESHSMIENNTTFINIRQQVINLLCDLPIQEKSEKKEISKDAAPEEEVGKKEA